MAHSITGHLRKQSKIQAISGVLECIGFPNTAGTGKKGRRDSSSGLCLISPQVGLELITLR
jgi:hypothetical protein